MWYLQPNWWWLSWNLSVQTALIYSKVTIYAGISPDPKLLWVWILTFCFKFFYISYNHLHFVITAPQKSFGWSCRLPFFWEMWRLGWDIALGELIRSEGGNEDPWWHNSIFWTFEQKSKDRINAVTLAAWMLAGKKLHSSWWLICWCRKVNCISLVSALQNIPPRLLWNSKTLRRHITSHSKSCVYAGALDTSIAVIRLLFNIVQIRLNCIFQYFWV